jgi:hypothetical protein
MECDEEGPPRRRHSPVTNPIGKVAEVKYVGLDWAYRSAQWCALAPRRSTRRALGGLRTPARRLLLTFPVYIGRLTPRRPIPSKRKTLPQRLSHKPRSLGVCRLGRHGRFGGCPVERRWLVGQDFLACDRDQELLLPPSLREWLPEDHLAWFVLDAVEEIDLSAFYGFC